jgi:hypothetical protein
MDNNYKLKYLKYRNKYLSLKNELLGGSNCPRIGFNQHSGECWNDSFSMIVLFSDKISDPIQRLFDNDFLLNNNYEPNPLWFEYINDFNNNKHLLPPNIETKEDFNIFLTYGKLYIEELFNRYHNDKLAKTIKKSQAVINIQNKLINPKVSKLTQDSTDLLERYIYLEQINQLSQETRQEIKEELDAIFSQIQQEYNTTRPIDTHNIPPKLYIKTGRPRSSSESMSLKCVEYSLNIANVNKTSNANENGGGLIDIMLNLSIINYFLIGYYYKYIKTVQMKRHIYKELKLTNHYIKYDNYNIINISSTQFYNIYDNLLTNKYNGAYIILTNTKAKADHAQAFITCSTNNNFFYDNNSTTDNKQQPLQKFDWKKYLISVFNKAHNMDNTLLDLSDIYKLVGHSYLENFKIETILFFHNIGSIDLFSSNIIEPEEINFINYDNQNIINQYTRYIIANPNLINTYIPMILSFDNWKLLDNIMKINNKKLILKIRETLIKNSYLFPEKIGKISSYFYVHHKK